MEEIAAGANGKKNRQKRIAARPFIFPRNPSAKFSIAQKFFRTKIFQGFHFKKPYQNRPTQLKVTPLTWNGSKLSAPPPPDKHTLSTH